MPRLLPETLNVLELTDAAFDHIQDIRTLKTLFGWTLRWCEYIGSPHDKECNAFDALMVGAGKIPEAQRKEFKLMLTELHEKQTKKNKRRS